MPEFTVFCNGIPRQVALLSGSAATIGGKSVNFSFKKLSPDLYLLTCNGSVFRLVRAFSDKDSFGIYTEGNYFHVFVQSELDKYASLMEGKAQAQNRLTEVRSPMSGMVLKVRKNKGDAVKKGESVIILEAMKMENDIKSPLTGAVKDVYVPEQAAVDKGTLLFSVE